MYELYRQIKDSRFSNWLDVAVGVSITTKGISDYLEATIVSLHHDIKYGACAGLPNCRHNCSRTEQNLSSWCPTCKDWKKQIMLHNKYKTRDRQIKWSEINSSQWPYDINEMVKVFAPDWWKARTPYTEDLSVALHVFHNCKKFNILFEPCQRVRGVRNALFAHGQLEASDIEKKQALIVLVAFLKQPEISRTVSGKLAISQLKRLRSNSVINLITKEESFKQHLAKALNPINMEDTSMLGQNDIIQEMRLQLYKPKEDIVNRISRRPAALIGVFVLSLLLFTFLFTFYWNKSVNTGLKEKDCLPMTFSSPCPWKPDFTFDSYLSDRSTLFGRKWLINKIQFSLMATSLRGIMLTAEMGYGKSTLVSNLLCDDELFGGSRLHKYVLSYHICKFDVISTQKPEYFIKNLVGMLISKLPEAGNAILTDELAMRFLQTSKCAEDPVGCIDVAIIHPLRTLTFNEERYVIIDAMDECGESAAITMSLLDVLSKRISKLPWWLKFFITSRDINRVTSKLPGMQLLHETSKNNQNRKDIAMFIDSVMSIHQTSLTRLFGEYIDTKKVRKHILRIGGSNFLYVDLAVKFWIESPHSKLSDIPQSLNEFYAMNLDRVFGDNEHLYGLARNVFEVLCISYQGLELEELEAILNVTAYPYELRNLLGNQIAHFVTHKHYIRIYHKAICDYLTNNGSAYHKYHISISNGHTLFANYLLREYNNSIENILDLFIHVAESKDSDLLHSLQHSNYFLRMNLSSIKHLHQMAKTRNSFLGTKLLIRALGRQHIDSLTSANVTATFLAAAFGNSETLRALIDENGNYSFRVANPPNKGGLEDAVNHCKYKTLWGYGLLDIASQNGHTEVINLLLAKNQTLLYSKNGLGLTAVHLAAEHGHVHILDTFLEKDNTQADHHSLYLASKNGHLLSVKTLLRHGVKDSCVCCGDKLHWISNNTKRMQWHPCYNTSDGIQCVTYIEDENATFVLNDDLRLVKCTTALEIALQNGYNKIASHLLLQIPNALSCREYGGRTAFLTAVKYNQSDVVDIMLKKGANVTDKCERAFNVTVRYSLSFFSVNEIIALENDMCPLGTTVEHFVATSGNKDIAERLRNKGIYLNWRVQDESGNTPLHYAACNNEWEMLIYMINTGNGDIYLEAKNGSLPIHSAVLCNAIMSYAALQQYHVRSNRILIDNEGREEMFNVLKSKTMRFWDTCYDRDGYNILHHAVMGGNYETVKFLLSNGLTLSGPPLSKVTDLISLGVTHADIYEYGHLESRPWMHDCKLLNVFSWVFRPVNSGESYALNPT
ncbi:ankyrin repeat domain-containing protein 50-like [Ylistrum balloti]|uniref:ankyrin repeat domain-containing protein 50-like n=1 Tax=Ylistrum balloti TaxID=509963 RepID=UPI002905A0FA|nr:ankyrin repeat domain-containing protein 50-like [Ylistrum balloti]